MDNRAEAAEGAGYDASSRASLPPSPRAPRDDFGLIQYIYNSCIVCEGRLILENGNPYAHTDGERRDQRAVCRDCQAELRELWLKTRSDHKL